MVHYGQAENILRRRQGVLDVAYQPHPERFVRSAPKPPAVGRQNVSRDEKRGAPGRSGPEYDHRLDTARRLWRAGTRGLVELTCIYKGPAESRSGLGGSIVTMVQPA
jgi:hypothetical protein